MRTLRTAILEMYDRADNTVGTRLKRKGYLTWEEFGDCLQKEFDSFEQYYMKKYNVDPFSEAFVDIVFNEYETYSIKKLGLKTLIPPQEEAERMGGGLIGLSEEILKKTYTRFKKDMKTEK